jgi:predicted component of type VI protein secretion system
MGGFECVGDGSFTDYTGVIAHYRDKKTGKERTVTAGDQSKPKRLR